MKAANTFWLTISKRNLVAGVVAISVALAGCQSVKKITPGLDATPSLVLKLRASESINRVSGGPPAPVRVRIYVGENFDDLASIQYEYEAGSTPAPLSVFFVEPGVAMSRTYDLSDPPGSVAVVAEYRDKLHSEWRSIMQTRRRTQTQIHICLDQLRIFFC